MLFDEFIYDYLQQLRDAQTALHLEWTKVSQAVGMIRKCRGTVWLIGNGGSATLASHMATDLQLAGVRAQALTDAAAITTIANDQNYVDVFTTQLSRLSREGDLLIAITTSGNSYNILHAIAGSGTLPVILMTGFDGGRCGRFAETDWKDPKIKFNGLHLNVPAKHTGVVQDVQQSILHMITYFLMGERNEKRS